MDTPEQGGEGNFAAGEDELVEIDAGVPAEVDRSFVDLTSIENEQPTLDAVWHNEPDVRFYFKDKDSTMDVTVPSGSASQLLETAANALPIAGAVFAPMLTLKAVPQDLPGGVGAGIIVLQLVVVILVVTKAFFKPSRAGSRLG